ncbi:hypothetical protein [Pseudomonas pharyngis]|uniref:hypothetical protein n=1 Tax=Pseudomonas pharyngis TaxID=2892333 RepID=UPI003FD64DAE
MRNRYTARRRCWKGALFFAVFLCITSFQPPMDVLRVHIGKTYQRVERDSTFDVEGNTAFYPGERPHPSSTWISSPAIVEFDDPVYGFKLSPTIFGAVTYRDWKVRTLTTSPMSATMPFGDAVVRLGEIQNMLKTQGWKLESFENNDWFNVDSVAEREQLRGKLFDQAVGIDLYVPKKYSLLLLIKCYARCDKHDPDTAKYLIDVSVGIDHHSD